MRAAVLENVGSQLIFKHLPDPTPAAGDAVLKVIAVPVLNYAKEVFSGDRAYPNLSPLVPGFPPSTTAPARAKLKVGASRIGRVDTLGPGAVFLKPGQPVFFDTTVRVRDNPTTIMLQGCIAQEENGGQK